MTLRADWQTAKGRLLDRRAGLPEDIAKQMGKGADLGPTLDKLEKAKGYEAQQKLLPDALKAKGIYEKGIAAMQAKMKSAKPQNAPGLKAIDVFEKDLKGIWREVEALCAPPRPLGRMVPMHLLFNKTIGASLKLRNFAYEGVEVRVTISIDEVLADIIKNELQGALFTNLMAAVKKEHDKHEKAFVATIKDLDAKLGTMLLDREGSKKLTKEANEVLAHYGRILEDRLGAVVDQLWKEFIGRQQHLKGFKKECVISAVTNTIAIGVAATSIALSFGTALINVLVIAKSVGELAKTLDRATRTVDEAEKDMRDRLGHIEELVRNRVKALKSGEGQKANKAGEMAKTALVTLFGSYSKDFVNTTKYTENLAKEYNGKISDLEKKSAEMYKSVQKMAAAFPSDKDAPDARTAAKVKKAFMVFKSLQQEFEDYNRSVQKRIKLANRVLKLCDAARKLDPEIKKFEIFLTTATTAAALYSVSNLVTMIDTGKSVLTHSGNLVSELS